MKISELGLAGTLSGTEVLPIVQSGTTKKVSIDDVVALAGGGSGSTGYNGLTGTTNIGLGGNLVGSTYIDADNNTLYIRDLGQGSVIKNKDDINNYLESGIKFPTYTNRVDLFAENTQNGDYKSLFITNDYLKIFSAASGDIGLIVDFNTFDIWVGYNTNLGGSAGIAYLFFNGSNGNAKFINTITNDDILNLDITTNKYNFGYSGSELGIRLNNNNPLIYTSNQGQDSGLYIDFANGNFGLINNSVAQEGIFINDLFGANKSIYIGFGDSGKASIAVEPNVIRTNYSSNNVGLKLDFVNFKYTFGAVDTGICGLSVEDDIRIVSLGDITGNGQGTIFGVDDNAQKLIASTNLLTTSSGSSSGQHLKINIAGTNYVIELKNP